MKIGVFDSGVGGLTVLALSRICLPDADFIYYADESHVPYGEKTAGEIIEYVDYAVSFLVKKGVDAVILACNTATSIAVGFLREKYSIPIVGMEPALMPAVRRHPEGRILVCATEVTIHGEKLRSLIESSGSDPDLIAMPELVRLAEAEQFGIPETVKYLREKTGSTRNYDAVVLGCTHFSLFRDSFRQYFGRETDLIDGNLGTVKRIKAVLGVGEDPCLERAAAGAGLPDRKVKYYFSGSYVRRKAELERLERLEERYISMIGV